MREDVFFPLEEEDAMGRDGIAGEILEGSRGMQMPL